MRQWQEKWKDVIEEVINGTGKLSGQNVLSREYLNRKLLLDLIS
jgi:hypothetical protein